MVVATPATAATTLVLLGFEGGDKVATVAATNRAFGSFWR